MGVVGNLCPGEGCETSNDCHDLCCAESSNLCTHNSSAVKCIGEDTVRKWVIGLLCVLILLVVVLTLCLVYRCRKKNH